MMVQLGEKMNTMITKFIIVSPPRTGTMSMCQMMKDLGFTVNHVPGPYYKDFMTKDEVLADTPVFSPSIIEYALKESDNVKFIYMNKSPQDWTASMEKVGLNRAFTDMRRQVINGDELAIHSKCDYEALYELLEADEWITEDAEASFVLHYNKVLEMIPSERLLEYKFSDGWGPLCEFVGKDVPSTEVPHLNIDTMFDKIT